MKYLHIVSNWNYTVIKPYIKFVNENFNIHEHFFLIRDKSENIPYEILNYKNVKAINNKSKRISPEIKTLLSNAEKILFHALKLNIYDIFFLLRHPQYLRKIVWIAWGGDLYEWRSDHKNIFKRKIIDLLHYMIRKQVRFFVGIFPPDIEYFKQEFNSGAETLYASYVGNLYSDIYKQEIETISLKTKAKHNSTINIQVGHQGNPVLNHIEVLNDLKKYKKENIKIFIPLNYGPNEEYIRKVHKTAIEMYGDKVIVIREKMSKEDYMLLLSKMDIAIFNTPRQIGLGNITPLLYMEKKIFMPKGSIMYNFYTNQQVNICNYDAVRAMDFKQFITPIDPKNAKNYVISNELNLLNKINMWNNVFNLQ